ncbi:hypothetical protein [Salinarimonas rosea]|uniref:hypothetical protein n=1 Tax=Salinarimonas rosea TaxID=552063 RepID=UPI0012EB1415|nr:hypothetical protein [Salinarimonas rosea]
MSDGPHRSLPMKRHWRDLAERAAKAAYAADEVREAVPLALRKDARKLPLEQLRAIFGGGDQASLFPNERIEQLEAARQGCRGSGLGNAIIDAGIEAVRDGHFGDAAYGKALANAFADYTRSEFRSVEEHYLREAGAKSARFVRSRLDAARSQCDFGALASEFLAPARPARSLRLPKQTGLDEGPPL